MHIVSYIKYLMLVHGIRIHEVIVPFVLFIDFYYRLEWFELHTAWGPELLGPLFADISVGTTPTETHH